MKLIHFKTSFQTLIKTNGKIDFDRVKQMFSIQLMHFNIFSYRQNFLHLDIFMRELSYEEITTQRAYDLTNLWSEYTLIYLEMIALLAASIESVPGGALIINCPPPANAIGRFLGLL